jgi:type IV pilus assembly protein PilY1
LRPVAGNNFAYIAEFSTGDWQGDVRAYEIRLADGDILRTERNEETGEDGQIWSAAKVLNAGGFKRNLYVAKAGQLAPFNYDNVKDSGHFDGKCNLLAQCIALSDAEKTLANDGKNLVAYLAGQPFDAIYRKRKSLLGDVVSSAPVYDGAIAAQYTDAGYAAFASGRKDRLPVVYVGANDGFMHAFYAGPKTETLTPGQELWAFSPTAVHKNLYLLATEDYATRHRYYVDGPATLADVHNGVEWRTILVFGLGAGGNQYTALDVTNPAEPKLLWEFTDPNLGMTHAKPIVTKRKSTGRWVVAVPSGFNNVGGDGKGHLFLIDAATGAKVVDIATSKGDKANPSGLGPLNSWVESDSDNTATRYYAGDNDGNVWRFDTEGLVEPKNAALLLAELGSKQAVTTLPAMAEVDYKGVKNAVVYIGTGRSVGVSDLSSVDLQSIYGIRDQLTAVGWGVVRGSGQLVEQKLQIDGNGKRTVTKNPVDWAKDAGWQLDLTDPSSQRINVPMQLFGNTLIAAANIPVAEGGLTCEAGGFGSAYIYYIDIATGGADDIDLFSESQVAGFTILTLPSGKNIASIIPVKGNDKAQEVKPAASYGNKASRANWRTLTGR